MLVEAVQSGAELTSNTNIQTVSDFWMFVVYCLVVIVVVLFFLFYFNRALGQILTWLINQYTWRRYNAYIEVDSIRVTLLGARLLFKNLRYHSTNQSISIVKGHISIQYWLLNVRKADSEKTDSSKSKLPCRIVCSMEGLEWFLYNNAPAYESMRNALGVPLSPNSTSTDQEKEPSSSSQQTSPSDQSPSSSPPPQTTTARTEVRDPESQVPVETSLLLRLMPIQFECTTGAIMIGNNELRSMIVGQYVQASGTWSVSESRAEMDHYKSVLDLTFRKPQISLKDNMDFTYAHPESTIVSNKKKPLWQRALKFIITPFHALFHPAAKTRQFGHMQHMHEIMRAQRDSDRTTGHSTTFHEDYACVNNVIECSKMAVLYYADVAGPVPSTDVLGSSGVGIDVGNGGLPPEWGVRILMWNAMFHYGPWTDRQRTELQGYFFPNSHRNNVQTPHLKPGDQRTTTAFELHVELMTEGTLRIPTREKSKDWKYETESADLDLGADGFYTRPYGWIDIKTGPGSTAKIIIPFVCGADGFTSNVDIHLKDVDASTSVNYASLLQAKNLQLSIRMHSPIVWNAYREWEFSASIREPQIFLLRDHVFLFQDLVKDWTSTPPADLLHFIPITYNFNIDIHEPLIYLCVNEHNIISNPNALDDNAYIKLHTNKLRYTMTLPFMDFEPEINVIKFLADLDQFDVAISLQSSHTLSAFMEKENSQFGMSVSVGIEGSYEYYTSVDVLRHIESLNLNIKLNGVTCKLFGTVIRYILILKDNYAGQWINFSTIDEYRQRRQEPRKWQEMKKRQADAKPIQDPFEVYILVDIQDGSLLLPENLYDCSHYSQMDFQELQVEIRNLDIYMDMYITVSPITWTRESYSDPSSKKAFIRSRNGRDQGNFLYIDGLNIYAHRLFGPLPEIATYLCHWEFEVGRITGEVKPSFLLGTTNFAQTFVYDMIDEDNAVPAEIAPAADPDVTFLKASVKEIDVYLMNDHSVAKINVDQGLELEFDNLVNEKYNQRVNVNIPALVATTLANQDHHMQQGLSSVENEFSWVEVARLSTGMNITVFRHSKEWQKMRNAQQNFIRAQDYATRRCTHLYESEHDSHAASHLSAEYHVGVLYAPPYRLFHPEEQGTGVNNEPNPGYLMRTPSHQPESYALRSFTGVAGASDVPSVGSYMGDWIDGNSYLDRRSRQSVKSNDDESFHTAYSNDPASRNSPTTGQDLEAMELYDHYSSDSMANSESDDDSSHIEDWAEDHQKGKAPEATSIPPSIPYSGYLNRYSVKAASPPGTRTRGFFHPYLPPPKTLFAPLKEDHRKKIGGFDTNAENKKKENPVFLFPGTDTLPNVSNSRSNETFPNHEEDESTGNEVVVTAILEATSPLQILMTPILVKIVQEVSEAINRYDWDLESMLDMLQIEYVGQLTRYLTDQFVCTRFAVSLPKMHFHFIQNVMLPDDLPSYKDGKPHIKTQYDERDTMLCSADVTLDSFSMIGSVKFEDEAYDEKQKSVAESKLVLRESRVHIDVGDLECKVQYVSERHESPHEPMVFGIPKSRQHTRSSSQNDMNPQEDDGTTELVVIDFAVRKFAFKWLGATKPNYFDLTIDDISTMIITEAVEILVGAVYSWLVFVDDFKSILQQFQGQRSRQLQMFIHELSSYSQHPSTVGDPLFLTKPATVLRLGSRNFRNDVGWKLLARMRYCLRTIDSGTRARLQYKLSQNMNSTPLSSKQMFENVVKSLSLWRSWEIGEENISKCRLFTQPFNQCINVAISEKQKSDIDKVVELLISSINMGKVRIESFEFCIFEEEQETDDNSISIGPVELSLETEYKRPPIGNEESAVPRASSEVERNRQTKVPQDGYLDVVSKVNVGSIHVNINPTILAFARHMLTVQRVFTAKLQSLAHATTIATADSSVATMPSNTSSINMDALISRIDVVAQGLVTVQYIDVCARAQKLTMQSQVRGIQGSALFSNPKLTPLHIFSTSERAESDSGSGVRSSNKTSRRHGNNNSNRLILEAAGGIEYIDTRFYEMKTYKIIDELLVITLNGANVSANICQPTKTTRKQPRNSTEPTSISNKEVLNVFSNIHKFHIHAPQSLLRLYEFIENWRSEQGQRYEFLFQNLLNEWEEQRKVTHSASHLKVIDAATASSSRRKEDEGSDKNKTAALEKKYDLKLQFLLNQFEVLFDLLPSLSVKYLIDDFFVMVNENQVRTLPVQKYAVQLSKQEIQLITKSNSPVGHPQKQIHEEYSGGTFSMPGIRCTGNLRSETKNGVNQLHLHFMVFVDFISLSLNVSMIDSFLTAQSLLGNEIGELIEVLSYDKQKRKKKDDLPATAAPPANPSTDIKYSMDVNLSGLRISAASPSALALFESNGLEAHLSNDMGEADRVLWKVRGYNFVLSLEHNTGLPPPSSSSSSSKSGQQHRNRLAYIVTDFEVQNHFPQDMSTSQDGSVQPFYVDVSRIQAVMQPIALGKLAEMYIYYDSELKKKKEMKKTELDQIATTTKRLVQSFKRDLPKKDEETLHSLWEGKLLSLTVQRIGIAVPLEAPSATDHHHHHHHSHHHHHHHNYPLRETSALLLSVGSIHFLTKNIEKSAATLEKISLQFVKRFDQNNEEHFLAERHPRMNQMHLPSIACHVYTRSQKPKQFIKIDAKVGGFEVDIDGAFSEYVNALNVIYVKSKDRVNAFTKASGGTNNTSNVDNSGSSSSNNNNSNNNQVVYLDLEGMFEYQSGVVRMYPKRHSGEANRKRMRSNKPGTNNENASKMATIKVPGLTAWVTYQTPLTSLTSAVQEAPRFHGDITIHESDNTLHPSLVQFLQEVIAGLKFGMQQSSERKAIRSTTSTASATTTSSPNSSPLESNINASLALRLSRTKLDLSCQPTSKVVCSLSWDESEFLMHSLSNEETASRTMSCVGYIGNVSAIVKHHFSPEACLTARVDQLLMNAMLTSERGQDGLDNDVISIIVKMPSANVDVNVRHLQDLLILNSCWFDQNSINRQQTQPQSQSTHQQQQPVTPIEETPAPKPFSRYVSMHIGVIILSVDLGQAIGKITLSPENLGITSHHVPSNSKGLSMSLDKIRVASEGRLSGDAHFDHLILQLAFYDTKAPGEYRTPSLLLFMDEFRATFEYEFQHLLDIIQEPIELRAQLIAKNGSHELDISARVRPLLACVSIKAVPVMITMYKRFTELLEKKKLEAGIQDTMPGLQEKSSASISDQPPAAAQVEQSPPQRLSTSLAHVSSSIDIRLDSVEIIVYPSQFQDVDNVELCAYDMQLVLQQNMEFMDNGQQEEEHRTLAIRLAGAALMKNVPGVKLMVKRNTAKEIERQAAAELKTAGGTPAEFKVNKEGSRTLASVASQPKPASVPPAKQAAESGSGGVSIFGIPSVAIHMESNQFQRQVEHIFSASFGGRVNVSLNLGLIRYLQELTNMFSSQMERALQHDTAGRRPSGVPAEDANSFDSGVAVNQARAPSPTTATTEVGKMTKANELVYKSNAPVNFNPQLQIMGDATPPVEWLGFKRERLPALVHENITLVLDQFVHTLYEMYEKQ